ncbi:MAG: dTDP-4-dehydrorhamnose 3,5-epimerase [Acidobacteriota bacterium]
MPFEKNSEHLNGVIVLKTKEFHDDRGSFMEMYRADQFKELDIPYPFVQENYSFSKQGVVRGLHFQWEPPMGKLMRVLSGRAFIVAADIRKNSPTFGQWFGLETSRDERIQMWAPAGFARGFCALSETVEIQYLCTGTYNPACESGIRWNDKTFNINWPVKEPLLSEKDDKAQSLEEWTERPESDFFKL